MVESQINVIWILNIHVRKKEFDKGSHSGQAAKSVILT